MRKIVEDGRLTIDDNSAERGMRGIAVRGKSAASTYTLIETAKLNGVRRHGLRMS